MVKRIRAMRLTWYFDTLRRAKMIIDTICMPPGLSRYYRSKYRTMKRFEEKFRRQCVTIILRTWHGGYIIDTVMFDYTLRRRDSRPACCVAPNICRVFILFVYRRPLIKTVSISPKILIEWPKKRIVECRISFLDSRPIVAAMIIYFV